MQTQRMSCSRRAPSKQWFRASRTRTSSSSSPISFEDESKASRRQTASISRSVAPALARQRAPHPQPQRVPLPGRQPPPFHHRAQHLPDLRRRRARDRDYRAHRTRRVPHAAPLRTTVVPPEPRQEAPPPRTDRPMSRSPHLGALAARDQEALGHAAPSFETTEHSRRPDARSPPHRPFRAARSPPRRRSSCASIFSVSVASSLPHMSTQCL